MNTDFIDLELTCCYLNQCITFPVIK